MQAGRADKTVPTLSDRMKNVMKALVKFPAGPGLSLEEVSGSDDWHQ